MEQNIQVSLFSVVSSNLKLGDFFPRNKYTMLLITRNMVCSYRECTETEVF